LVGKANKETLKEKFLSVAYKHYEYAIPGLKSQGHLRQEGRIFVVYPEGSLSSRICPP
jgi:hypothetical protein